MFVNSPWKLVAQSCSFVVQKNHEFFVSFDQFCLRFFIKYNPKIRWSKNCQSNQTLVLARFTTTRNNFSTLDKQLYKKKSFILISWDWKANGWFPAPARRLIKAWRANKINHWENSQMPQSFNWFQLNWLEPGERSKNCWDFKQDKLFVHRRQKLSRSKVNWDFCVEIIIIPYESLSKIPFFYVTANRYDVNFIKREYNNLYNKLLLITIFKFWKILKNKILYNLNWIYILISQKRKSSTWDDCF